MFPEVHPSVGSDRGEESKDSSGGMTEHSHPQHWAFPISWVEPCTQDGNISIIPDLHRRGLPSCHMPRISTVINCFPFLGSDMVVRIC